MIAIVNVSKKYSRIGLQDYEVRINTDVITRFRHRSEEGLAKCLMEAAKAVEREKWQQIQDILAHVKELEKK